jgi:uncharacterized membrane protein YidH (DUF202 family)
MRMTADRTLIPVIRTSLSVIGFDLAVMQFLEKRRDAGPLKHAAAPRPFGIALILLILLLLSGSNQFVLGLRQHRKAIAAHLFNPASHFPGSPTLVTVLPSAGARRD